MNERDPREIKMVWFQDVEMAEGWPQEIVRAQRKTTYVLGGQLHQRVPYGKERPRIDSTVNCHDCGVIAGQYHVPGCDMEQCPRCGHQKITCLCGGEESDDLPY